MSEINSFSDYTNKYNSNVDYSALFGGTSNSSSLGGTNILSDYASIKNGSYASKISQKATSIGNAASRSKAVTYTSSGSYSNTLPKLVPSTVDERVGDKDKSSDTSSKTTEK